MIQKPCVKKLWMLQIVFQQTFIAKKQEIILLYYAHGVFSDHVLLLFL